MLDVSQKLAPPKSRLGGGQHIFLFFLFYLFFFVFSKSHCPINKKNKKKQKIIFALIRQN